MTKKATTASTDNDGAVDINELTAAAEVTGELDLVENTDSEDITAEDTTMPLDVIEPSSPAPEATSSPEKPRKKAKSRIIDANPSTEYKAKEEDIKWQQLKNYKISGTTCKGNIASIEKNPDENGYNTAIVMFNGQPIAIPGNEMGVKILQKIVEEGTEEDKVKYVNKVLARMLGAEIDFIIKSIEVNGTDVVITASRKAAMLRNRREFRTFENGVYHINEGDIIRNARVIASSYSVMRVEALGVEMDIHKTDISYEWVDEIRAKYPVGTTCNVCITEINNRTDPDEIAVKASIKMTEKNMIAEHMKRIQEQGRYMGKVITITSKYIYLFIPDFGVRAACTKVSYPADFPNVGDVVAFVAKKMYDDAGIVYGVVPSIISRKK